jgi:hypothetical protein
MGSLCGVKVSLERMHFRTINVQWIGQWGFLAVVAVPGINNLHTLNTVISSTPAASTNISFSINTIQRNKISYNSVPQSRFCAVFLLPFFCGGQTEC